MNLDNLMTAAVGLKALGNELEKLVPHISSIQDHTVATLTSHLDQAMIDFRHSLLADVRSVVNEAVGGLRAEVGGLRVRMDVLQGEVGAFRRELDGFRDDFRRELGVVNQNIEALRSSTGRQLNELHQVIALGDSRSGSRVINSRIRDPLAPLATLVTNDGLVPFHFPANITDLRAMDLAKLQEVLGSYDQNSSGNRAELLARLARYIGVGLL
jgi:hypothetical protein